MNPDEVVAGYDLGVLGERDEVRRRHSGLAGKPKECDVAYAHVEIEAGRGS